MGRSNTACQYQKKRVKERNRRGSKKAKGRRTTEEDRGRSGGRTRKELVRRSHRLIEGERVCWWMWSSALWFGPVQLCYSLAVAYVGWPAMSRETNPGKKVAQFT